MSLYLEYIEHEANIKVNIMSKINGSFLAHICVTIIYKNGLDRLIADSKKQSIQAKKEAIV